MDPRKHIQQFQTTFAAICSPAKSNTRSNSKPPNTGPPNGPTKTHTKFQTTFAAICSPAKSNTRSNSKPPNTGPPNGPTKTHTKFQTTFAAMCSPAKSNTRSNSKPPNTGPPNGPTKTHTTNSDHFCRYVQPREVEHSIQLETTKHRTTQCTHENTYKHFRPLLPLYAAPRSRTLDPTRNHQTQDHPMYP